MQYILAIVAAVVLVFTNPTVEQHQTRIQEVATVAATKVLDEEGILGKLAKLLKVDKVMAGSIASSVERRNLLVCSVGVLDGTFVSFGVLNCVFVRSDCW